LYYYPSIFCAGRDDFIELEDHLLLAKDLGLLETADYRKLAEQITEIKRILTAPIQKLNALQKLASLLPGNPVTVALLFAMFSGV
jgi:hypothetical protein